MISKANIQLVTSLQDKKQRQKYDQFIVEGEKSITELLTSDFKIVKLCKKKYKTCLKCIKKNIKI